MPDLPDWSRALPPHLLASGSVAPPGPTTLTVDLQGEQSLFIDCDNPFTVIVTGTTTGLTYGAVQAGSGTAYVPVSPVDDPSVDVELFDTKGLGLTYAIRGIPADIRRLVLQAGDLQVQLQAQAPANAGPVLLLTDANGNLLVAPYPQHVATLGVHGQSAAGGALTVTLPAPGAGLTIYVDSIFIRRTANATVTGTGNGNISTTNLPGATAGWSAGNAIAIGAQVTDVDETYSSPLQAAASNTAVTITCPAFGTGAIWTVQVFYHVAAPI